ncbi:hypothetical protein C8R44DRAFT_853261 [Mycena epipterygia]|nr:hypothetical protein C8R44DRAFT_853261 [Mycena epipterygia]
MVDGDARGREKTTGKNDILRVRPIHHRCKGHHGHESSSVTVISLETTTDIVASVAISRLPPALPRLYYIVLVSATPLQPEESAVAERLIGVRRHGAHSGRDNLYGAVVRDEYTRSEANPILVANAGYTGARERGSLIQKQGQNNEDGVYISEIRGHKSERSNGGMSDKPPVSGHAAHRRWLRARWWRLQTHARLCKGRRTHEWEHPITSPKIRKSRRGNQNIIVAHNVTASWQPRMPGQAEEGIPAPMGYGKRRGRDAGSQSSHPSEARAADAERHPAAFPVLPNVRGCVAIPACDERRLKTGRRVHHRLWRFDISIGTGSGAGELKGWE